MDGEDRDSLERLQVAARQWRNTPAWTRVQAIVLAKQGDSAVRIAHALGRGCRAVQTWVAASNGGGLEALEARPCPGRTPDLAAVRGGPLPGAARGPARPRG